MGFRDRFTSAVAGHPAPADSDPDRRRRPDNGNVSREKRPCQTRVTSASSTSLAAARALPKPTTSTPDLALIRIPRPYGSGGIHEPVVRDPSRRLRVAGGTSDNGSTAASRIRNRVNRATAPRSRDVNKEELEEIEELAPLSEREIIDVTDEPISSSPGSVAWGQTNDGAQQSPSQQTTSRPNSSAPASTPRRNDLATKGTRSVHFADKVLAFTASDQPRALYLGDFDLDKSDEAAKSIQQVNQDNRGEISQHGRSTSSSRANTFAQRGTSRHTHTYTTSYPTPMLDPSFLNWHAHSPSPLHPFHHCLQHCIIRTHPHAWTNLPYHPHPHPHPYPYPYPSDSTRRRQIIFTEPSTNHFEQQLIWDHRDWRRAGESELMEGPCGCGCGCGWVGG